MRIIRFGTYALKIKSLSASDIGLEHEHAAMVFTIFQKVFHFWYIPIFPIDTFYKIKDRGTGKPITETTAKIRTAIDLKLMKQRTPLWSYSGAIVMALPLVLLLFYGLYGSVEDTIDGLKLKMAKSERIDLKGQLVKNPQIDDLYTFRTLTVDKVTDANGHVVTYKSSYFSSPGKVDYIVNYISKDSVGFEFFTTKINMDFTYGLKKEFRIYKNDLILTTKKYQDLNIFKYPQEPQSASKKIVGVFKISRTP